MAHKLIAGQWCGLPNIFDSVVSYLPKICRSFRTIPLKGGYEGSFLWAEWRGGPSFDQPFEPRESEGGGSRNPSCDDPGMVARTMWTQGIHFRWSSQPGLLVRSFPWTLADSLRPSGQKEAADCTLPEQKHGRDQRAVGCEHVECLQVLVQTIDDIMIYQMFLVAVFWLQWWQPCPMAWQSLAQPLWLPDWFTSLRQVGARPPPRCMVGSGNINYNRQNKNQNGSTYHPLSRNMARFIGCLLKLNGEWRIMGFQSCFGTCPAKGLHPSKTNQS